ncbi:MAG: PAS domain S-box protein, partial [Methanoregula sp.]
MPAAYSVLYVDDEPDLLEIAREFLESSDEFAVDTRGSAKEALPLLKDHRYDAIVSDFQMPGMNGIAFLREVRSSSGNVPFIIFTGRGREEVVIEALNSGADFYLQKGGEPEAVFAELTHMLRRAIQMRRAEISLVEQEQRYHDLQNANDLIQSIAPDGHFLFVNKKWQDTLGYTGNELATLTLFDIVHEESREHCKTLFPRVIGGEDVGIIDFVFRASDGRKVYVEGFASCKITNGKPQYTRGIFKDVTHRRETESALRESEMRFRTIFENSPYPISINSLPDMKFITVNAAFTRASGYSVDEVLGKNPITIGLLPLAEATKLVSRMVLKGRLDDVPLTLNAKEGRQVQVRFSTIPVTINNKTASMTMTAEVSRIREVEEELLRENRELRASEEKYRLLTEVTNDIIYMTDPEGRFIYVSPQVSRYGYHPDEMISRNCREFLEENCRTNAIATMKTTLLGGAAMAEVRIRDKDGNLHWMEDSGAPVLDASGSVVGVSGILRDITRRKEAEAAQRESEEKFRMLVEHSFDGILITDLTGLILFNNRAAANILGSGSDTDRVGSANLMDFVVPEAREAILKNFNRNPPERESYPVNYQAVTITGRKIWVEGVGKRIAFRNAPAVLVSLRDITARKRMVDALHRTNKQLNLLSSITRHDLLNKVAIILGNIEITKMGGGGPTDYPAVLDKIESSAAIMRSQLEFTRIYQNLGTKEPEWQKPGKSLSRAHLTRSITLKNELGDLEIYADLL